MFADLVDRLPIAYTEDGSDYDGPFSTYPEWHAMTLGFGLGFALVMALAVGRTPAIIVAATILRTVLYAHTGKTVEIAGQTIELPARYLRQIRKEPHYLDGGIPLGAAAAVGVELVTVGHVVTPALP